MRITQVQNNYLYEGLDKQSSGTMRLWESAGFKLKEAALSPDQIQQIFTAAEQGTTAGGSNRTMLGQGKDAAAAVNKAWEDLKTKIQNSAPIQAVDQKYDEVVAKIEAGLGGPDNAVNQVIQKYRAFAKEHPVAQGFIYSALIAAAGISGAGLGGAAVLGLLKMADKLMQGEKFSSAAYSGAKTGAAAFAASKVADLFKSPDPLPGAATSGATAGLSPEQVSYLQDLGKQGSVAVVRSGSLWVQLPDGTMQMLDAPRGASLDAMLSIVQKAAGNESIARHGKRLSEGQIYMIFNRAANRQTVMEGPLDALKGLAAKGMDKLKTAGHNLTTKITADKLNKAWQAAGSPTDSSELAYFLKDQGIAAPVIKQVYADLKIPAPGSEKKATRDPGVDPRSTAPAPKQAAAKPAAPAGDPNAVSLATDPAAQEPASEPAAEPTAPTPKAAATPAASAPADASGNPLNGIDTDVLRRVLGDALRGRPVAPADAKVVQQLYDKL